MEIGIDSFVAMFSGNSSKIKNDMDTLAQFSECIALANHAGIEVFGIGAYHRKG